ncbi:MAG: carbamoyl-phosphate synthase large subunit [Dehalococcoidales bacterium]|nr:carbamoyl-phosphate synthase large subunit [Dehalococcoidales bacterium]
MKNNTVLVVGSGPIIIGQAAEFDYAGAQACKSLREEGYRVVLINSNPATIMTDKEMADRIYIEPITPEIVESIIKKEKPFGILGTLGGQTGLNLTSELNNLGILEKYNVKILGTSITSIEVAEDRDKFRSFLIEINQPTPPSIAVNNISDAKNAADQIGYPVVIRPAYTLGGTGGGIAKNKNELVEIANHGISLSRVGQVLIEKSLVGWKEVEYEVMRDNVGNVITICNMENLDPMGVHTGDSIVVAPSQTLNDKEYQMLRTASLEIISKLEIKGGCNVQLALKPSKEVKKAIGDNFANDPEYYIIEVNPRVSRSSALASKATGYPIARIASKIAVGKNLDEITNPVTGKTFSVFEPSLDYCVVKIPRWPFDKFPDADRTLGTQMKATGEVMGIERSFEAALLKSIRSLENNKPDLLFKPDYEESNLPMDERIWDIAHRIRNGSSALEETKRTYIDFWFTNAIEKIINHEKNIINKELSKEIILESKELGFSDSYISKLKNISEIDVRNFRKEHNITPTYKMVDTCAAEFEAITTYFYSTYEDENEATPLEGEKAIVLGSGPIRIGQGIEFDYCSVHASRSLLKSGVKSILINSNPETVSTDFDTSSRLYFEPLDSESVLDIIENESLDNKLSKTLVQFGGQTAINMSQDLGRNKFPILGSSANVINLASERGSFEKIAEKAGVLQPKGSVTIKLSEAIEIANKVGYPVMVRPSYVLGGRAMEIVHSETELKRYFTRAQNFVPGQTILVDQYIDGIEIEIDAVCDKENVLIPGIMQHVERAGVHSGDSTAVYPAYDLSSDEKKSIINATESLGKTLGIEGLMNIQFIVKRSKKSFFDNKDLNKFQEKSVLYVIEVNPRSSRTIPFISKVTDVPMIDLAIKVMLGEKLKNLKYGTGLIKEKKLFAVKSPVFSMSKLSGVDTYLGPEMKSTGEVMGIDDNLPDAMKKAMIGAGMEINPQTNFLLSIADRDKEDSVGFIKKLAANGNKMYATEGTHNFIKSLGIDSTMVNKILSQSPTVLDVINQGNVGAVLNTVTGNRSSMQDGYHIRRKATEFSIPCYTSIDTAYATIANNFTKSFKVGTVDDYLKNG